LGSRSDRHYHYRLKAEELNFAMQVIEYRQRKREERERKRQEERERQHQYAATMQSVCGVQSVSTPPKKDGELEDRGGVDTNSNQVEILNKNWTEHIKVYGEMLAEAVDFGIEAVLAVLDPWGEEERWGAFLQLEAIAPDKMESLSQIKPNWSDLCVV
jgi:hypothetical protein